MNCRCGVEVPEQRAAFLIKVGKPITCMDCSTTQKVGGFMNVEGKTERSLIIADMEQIEHLHKISARAGTGVSKGVKMNQSYSIKHNK